MFECACVWVRVRVLVITEVCLRARMLQERAYFGAHVPALVSMYARASLRAFVRLNSYHLRGCWRGWVCARIHAYSRACLLAQVPTLERACSHRCLLACASILTMKAFGETTLCMRHIETTQRRKAER